MKRIIGILSMTVLPVLTMGQGVNSQGDEDTFLQLSNPWLGWVAIAALIFSFITMLLQAFRKPKVLRSASTSEYSIAINELRQDLRRLKGDDLFFVTRKDLKGLEERIKLLEDARSDQPAAREMEWTNVNQGLQTLETEEVHTPGPAEPDPQSQISPKLLYAKFADLDDGFSANVLSGTQNGENVYEIESVDDTAIYRISSDPSAQKYALAEYSFTLGKACELENQPFKGCQIYLKQKGLLLNLSGNWIIQQKAIIEFK